MLVRLATVDDAAGIAAVHVRAWQVGYLGLVPDSFLSSLSVEAREMTWAETLRKRESATYVAEEDREVLGWMSVGGSRDADTGPETGELWAIYVGPRHWSRGVGRALWSRGEGHLKGSGYRDVIVWLLKGNRRALRFYEAAGFASDEGREKVLDFSGMPVPEIRLRKQLATAGITSSGA